MKNMRKEHTKRNNDQMDFRKKNTTCRKIVKIKNSASGLHRD